MGKLFGTDGIRGMANRYPITPEIMVKIGRAVALAFQTKGHNGRIMVGKDTRISGHMLEHALASGICSGGADAFLAGVLPTPGLAFLARDMGLDAAVMISASHNPFYDNGIKVFRGDGFKLSDEIELQIEALITKRDDGHDPSGKSEAVGRVHVLSDASARYMVFLGDVVGGSKPFTGLNVALDCANGATSHIAPAVLKGLGAETRAVFFEPDGTNINRDCGSEHPERLCDEVVKTGADVGFCFDGDGDRVIAVDEKGRTVSGDSMLALCAKVMKEQGRLANNMVVSTVMSNIGLGLGLKGLDIDHVTTQVGDRYVLEEMVARGACIGGEDSGHMIFLDHHSTGDGVIGALKVVEAMKSTGWPLSRLAQVMTVFPQTLVNVEVSDKPPIDTVPDVVAAIARVEKSLGDKGRVLVRYSGTQPMCRVMVEGPTLDQTEAFCREIVRVVRETLGGKE